jgi:hypothetical protein
MSEADLVERLRTEYERFARTPKYDKLWLAPATHERLASLWLEAADVINAIEHLGHVETLRGRLEEIERLRNERDEARRLASEYACITEIGVRAFARNRGWDCFKEDNHNA